MKTIAKGAFKGAFLLFLVFSVVNTGAELIELASMHWPVCRSDQ